MNLVKVSTKTIDKAGRLTLPKTLREAIGIRENSKVDLYIGSNEIVIKKSELEDRDGI